jgi:hypothetical protein
MIEDPIRSAFEYIGEDAPDEFRDGLHARLLAELLADDATGDNHGGVTNLHPLNGRSVDRRTARRWWLAAAVIVAVLAIGLFMFDIAHDSSSVQTDTVPLTPAPSTNPATTALLPPVDSLPATLPATTSPTPTAIASIPVDPLPVTIAAPPDIQSLWVELEPGATAPLPPAPIPAHYGASLVWTGTELIVWGGLTDEPCCRNSQHGAAFDPTVGTWRQIAPPPDGVRPGVLLWTGTEMLDFSDGTTGTASAAYDPAKDKWRLISNPPVPGSVAFWIGDEAVLVREPDANHDGYVDSLDATSYAYDPATDEWRRLADGPWGRDVGWVSGGGTSAVWTGTTIITMTDTDPEDGILVNGYDPATDTWRALEQMDTVTQPVVIPGPGGTAATVAFLPLDPGSPVELIDDRGNSIGELAARPADLAGTCYVSSNDEGCMLTSLRAMSVGGEVLFWYSDNGWAFDPESQTWRLLPLDGRQPGWDGTEVVAADDLLFAWGADRDGLVYRAETPG